jgi:hypothetical protein
MPGQGKISCRQNRRLSSHGPLGIEPTEAPRILCLDILEFPQVADVALRKPWECFTAMYLPPGFDGRKFPLPRTTKEAFASLRSISSQLPFRKGGRFLRYAPCSLRYAVKSLTPISPTKMQISRMKSLGGMCRLSHLPAIEPRKREGRRAIESMRMGKVKIP